MSWILLIIAGLLEIGWAVGLKFTDGFRRPIASVLVVFAMSASLFLLSLAVRSIPLGTAYAIWVGIGVLGAVILGAILFHEPLTMTRTLFMLILLGAILGLKFSYSTER